MMTSKEFNLLMSIYDYLIAQIYFKQTEGQSLDELDKASEELKRAKLALIKAGNNIYKGENNNNE